MSPVRQEQNTPHIILTTGLRSTWNSVVSERLVWRGSWSKYPNIAIDVMIAEKKFKLVYHKTMDVNNIFP